jgi:hypothetical protein
MSETAAYIALIETASLAGVQSRQQYLNDHGPHDMGWNYANIHEVSGKLERQLEIKGFFRVYLHIPDNDNGVRYSMNMIDLATYREAEPFTDPVDHRRYLVHSKMRVESISELERTRDFSEFKSVDRRKPDLRHLQLGFLFVVDPEV